MAMVFDHSTLAQRVLFRTGSALENIAVTIASLGAKRVLLIGGPSADGLAADIAAAVPVAARIRDVVQHVPAENAAQAVSAAKDGRIDLLLAVGGGSAVGLAKIVACRTGIPIVAVPTTFSGSEATDVWGITEAGRKTTGSDPLALPKVVIYDALLSKTLPTRLALASGVNAAAHAVDGFWAPRADPINTALGAAGLRALVSGLRGMAADPGRMEAREETIYGAYLAAVAFASAGSGIHHKICHALGGTFNLPHAETHSVMIGYVAEFNSSFAPYAEGLIASALGSDNPGAGFLELRRDLGTPLSLAQLGFREADIPAAVEIILPAVPQSNPRPVTGPDLEAMLRAAWAGEPLGSQTPTFTPIGENHD